MRLTVRAVRLRVTTTEGSWGRVVTFRPGFNILRGGNSRGKTQVVQAMIYALGLERMLSARANVPLGSALTSELRTRSEEDSPAASVLRSWVAIELENEIGHVITAQRHVVHDRVSRDLVRVWEAPLLTEAGAHTQALPQEYFLHQSGSVIRELGFHRLLTSLLNWSLPQVSTYTGGPVLLYPDVIFPYMIVDQQSWGSVAPRKVDRYQIREPLRRATEFLLGLEGPESEVRRSELERDLTQLRMQWAAARTAVQTLAQTVGGRVTGIPEHAAGARAQAHAPEATTTEGVHLDVLHNDEWRRIDEVLPELTEELNLLIAAGTRDILPGVDTQTADELSRAKTELADLVAAARLVENDLSMEEAQLAALDRRLSSLQEERDRNRDIRTLVRLGSEVATTHLADHSCPTCQQSLDAVEAGDLGPTLDVEETVALLNAQINTANRMRDHSRDAVTQASGTYAALQRQADQVRTRIRALEEDLVAPANAVSVGDVARRVTLQLRLDEFSRVQSSLEERLEELSDIASRIALIRQELAALPEGTPASDTRRLDDVTGLMRSHLIATRFGSYGVNEVGLDQDSLRPTRAGFDIDRDVSASDVVRIKVAYLDAVLTVGVAQGVHPGLLVLDEPRQQDIDPEDYTEMLRYLSRSADNGQVIITSATPRRELDEMTESLAPVVIDLGNQRLLQPDVDVDPLDPGVDHASA